jgi:hypothetical protein
VKENRIWRWLALVGIAATITINVLANSLPINGLNTGEISDRFEIFFVPAGYVFSIWFVIYVGLIAFAVYQILPGNLANPRLDQAAGWVVLASAANIAWIFCWHYLLFGWSLVAMTLLLLSLIIIYTTLKTGREPVEAGEFWLVRVPFSIYLGWISVATIANVTQVLYFFDWGGWGISDAAWTAVMLGVATVLGWTMALSRRDIPYLLVLIWAFIGIALKFPGTQLVAVSAWAASGLLAAAVVWTALQGRSRNT